MQSLILTTLGLALTCASTRAEDAPEAFLAAGLKTLEIASESGDLDVEGGAGLDVKVTVANPDPEGCAIVMERDGDVLRLQAKSKSFRLWGSTCRAGFRVRAPKELGLRASSGSGKIRAAALDGALELRTGSGDIRTDDVSGEMSARLGSGRLAGSARSKNLKIRCGSGSVDLAGLLGSARVRSGSGDVGLAWAAVLGYGEVEVKAGSGNVSLEFPEDASLQARIKTGSGKVRSEFGETASPKLRVTVKTGSGDVTIRKGPPTAG